MTNDASRRAEEIAGDSHAGREPVVEVEFWFDPSCPFTWRTSVWLREVSRRRGLDVRWQLMSLSILNEGQDVPDDLRKEMDQGTRALRVLAAAGRNGSTDVGRLYEALGTRWHDEGGAPDAETLRAALTAAELPADLADAADDPSLDDTVRASHDRGQGRVGTDVGSPVLAVGGGRAYFGPVVVPPPTGAEADRLFDALRLLSSVPSFSELKTARAPF